MSRRVSLPGADELFRTTGGGMGLQPSSPADRRRKANGEPRVPAPAGESDPAARPGTGEEHASADADDTRARGGDCPSYTSAAADELDGGGLGGRRSVKKNREDQQ
ncbi:hypothetical protein GPA20_28305, partial [Streptomyces sp. 196(2019)]|nr:hypothetical protein [Streptomyces sp. 196(2019)]